jgi:tetratricopeptide (TPR) repeat protein
MLSPLLFASLLVISAPQDRATAPELFEKSRAAYGDGRFAEAAELLKRAYQLDPDPILLYNLARALENDGDDNGARIAYEQYLRNQPNARDRRTIEARIEKLWERQDEKRKLALAQRAVAAEKEQLAVEAEGPSFVPWIVAGVGAAVLASGGMIGVVAGTRDSASRSAPNQRDAVALRDEAEGLATFANVALASGAGIAAAGVIWGVIDLSTAPELGVVITPQTVGLAGRF